MKLTTEAAKEAERDELEAEGNPDEGGAHMGEFPLPQYFCITRQGMMRFR